jgi:hypothetical protein
MAGDFKGFSDKDFITIDGTTWRKDLSKLLVKELNKIYNSYEFKSRIPYNRRTIYLGKQPFFSYNETKYAYSAFFVTLDKEHREVGYKIERGFINEQDIGELEPGDSREYVFMLSDRKQWDWFRLKKNIQEDSFKVELRDLIEKGYKVNAFANNELYCSMNAEEERFISSILSWDVDENVSSKWGDIYISHFFGKAQVMDMNKKQILDCINNCFKDSMPVFEKCSL